MYVYILASGRNGTLYIGVTNNLERRIAEHKSGLIPGFTQKYNVKMLVWNCGGILKYTSLTSWNPKVVYSEYTISNEPAVIDGVTLPGGAAVAYAVQLPTGMDMVASFYDAGLDMWSLPRQLTSDEHGETALSLGCDGEDLVVAYLKTQTERKTVEVDIDGQTYQIPDVPQPARTDMCILHHTLSSDPAVSAISIEPWNPAPGSMATITATVENRGALVLQDLQVAFYDGDPTSGGTMIGDVETLSGLLVAGSVAEVSIPWIVPSSARSHQVFAVVDPLMSVEDRDRSNNTKSIVCCLPDLLIETGWNTRLSSNAVALVARVANAGVIPASGTELSWRLGDIEGPEIGRSAVFVIEPGNYIDVEYIWQMTEPAETEFVQVFALADCTDVVQEYDDTNNVGYQSARVPLYGQALTIGEARLATDNTCVRLCGKIVTAAFSDCFYIEEPDRSAGIRIQASAGLAEGDLAAITGQVVTQNGERVIIAELCEVEAENQPIPPALGVACWDLGGEGFGLQPGVAPAAGLNNIGLLVRVWGKVTSTDANSFVIDDGSSFADPQSNPPYMPVPIRVKVLCPDGVPPPAAGQYVVITGISSCEMRPDGKLDRLIRLRRAEDIQILQ